MSADTIITLFKKKTMFYHLCPMIQRDNFCFDSAAESLLRKISREVRFVYILPERITLNQCSDQLRLLLFFQVL